MNYILVFLIPFFLVLGIGSLVVWLFMERENQKEKYLYGRAIQLDRQNGRTHDEVVRACLKKSHAKQCLEVADEIYQDGPRYPKKI